MDLEKRCQRFVTELGIPTTQFCKRIDLSRTALYAWYNGNLRLSPDTLDRIEKYISKYGF